MPVIESKTQEELKNNESDKLIVENTTNAVIEMPTNNNTNAVDSSCLQVNDNEETTFSSQEKIETGNCSEEISAAIIEEIRHSVTEDNINEAPEVKESTEINEENNIPDHEVKIDRLALGRPCGPRG